MNIVTRTYRGYCPQVKRRVYGFLVSEDEIAETNIMMPSSIHKVLPETVGQFTGVFDKLSNPIYENDTTSKGYTVKFVNDGMFLGFCLVKGDEIIALNKTIASMIIILNDNNND